MATEITKAILAIVIVSGAVYAALTGNVNGVQYLVGIAGIVIGAYFGNKPLATFAGAFRKKE